MRNPGLIKTFEASGIIEANRIVGITSTGEVAQAYGPYEPVIGVTELACEPGDHVDVVMSGIAEVCAGEDVVAGVHVTADADGKACAAQDGSEIIGKTLEPAQQNELVSILITQAGPYVSAGDPDDGGNTEESPEIENNNGASEGGSNSEGGGNNESGNDNATEATPVEVTDESVSGTSEETWYNYQLAHANVVADPAPVVKSNDGNTTYTEDTDYIVDYTNGIITTHDCGSTTLTGGATIKVSYSYDSSAASNENSGEG